MSDIIIHPGLRRGKVTAPPSKSHLHRLLIADFLAGGKRYETESMTSEDVSATARCLRALKGCPEAPCPILDCGESGSTLRFLLPVSMALREETVFTASGRLPNRPIQPFLDLLFEHGVHSESGTVFPLHLYGKLSGGLFLVPGNISSQIVSGLLFALPLLKDNSEIRIAPPLQSAGYVDMTMQTIANFGIHVERTASGYRVRGNQCYLPRPRMSPEGDWSSAAFWFAMNKLGSDIQVDGLNQNSAQPDRTILRLLTQDGGMKDVSQCPDIFPALTIAAAGFDGDTVFTGIERLRMKESDRTAAMADVLHRIGVQTENREHEFIVHGTGLPFHPTDTYIQTFGDHRIAMSAAVAATVSDSALTISNCQCTAKSYPAFFDELQWLS